jgi:hypothetical protein
MYRLTVLDSQAAVKGDQDLRGSKMKIFLH